MRVGIIYSDDERHGGKRHRSHDQGRGRINKIRFFIKKNHDIHLIIECSGIWTLASVTEAMIKVAVE